MDNNYFRYTNQKCPVCGETFKGDDDIVVCPMCGTPHHRDCYKKNGECKNTDRHNEGFFWEPEGIEQSEQPFSPFENKAEQQSRTENPEPFRPQTENSGNNTGNPFFGGQAVQDPFSLFPKEIDNEVSTEEAASFVRVNAFKYLRNFFYAKSNRKTWNWAAFFFAPYWFFYRKMYKLGVIFMSLLIVVVAICSVQSPYIKYQRESLALSEKYSTMGTASSAEMYEDEKALIKENPVGAALSLMPQAVLIIIGIIAGIKGNKWYYDQTVKNVRQIKSETEDPNLRKLNIYKKGGTSMSAAVLSALAYFAVNMALGLLI
ncbi:MAG: DUF2628 domain-containing protein [Oscillospiraceae bacterium]|nr:DUF2628 domain-containing protein [Oscillospiraceae bacterium]